MSTTQRSALTNAGARILRSRWLVRAPIWIYKARLGALLGPRLLMLAHIGRKSGARRYVVLEVVDRPASDVYVVASGFGVKAQWFRNIQANPKVCVYAGGHRPASATARVMTQQETDRTLTAYHSTHPRAWERFKPVLEETLGGAIGDTDTPLPMVELQLG